MSSSKAVEPLAHTKIRSDIPDELKQKKRARIAGPFIYLLATRK